MPLPAPSGPSTAAIVTSVRSLMTPLQFPPAEPTHADQRYAERGGRGVPPLADIYLPDGDGPHPSVVLIHGGGWVLGHRRMKPMRYLATKLVEQGYAVFVPEYRLVFRGGRLTEARQDAVEALRWWVAQGERFSLDPAHLSLVGLSAGATLMLLAADAVRDEIPLFRVVPIFGVYDFDSMHGGLGRLIRPLVLQEHDPADVSPRNLAPLPCPVVLMHGTSDRLVPHSQAEALRDAWAEGDVRLVSYEGLPHAFFNDATSDGCKQATADLLAALA